MENFSKRYRFAVAKVEGISISQFISTALLRNWTASIRGINANKLIFGGANRKCGESVSLHILFVISDMYFVGKNGNTRSVCIFMVQAFLL